MTIADTTSGMMTRLRRMRDCCCYWAVMTVISPTSRLGLLLLPYAGNHAYSR